MQAQIVLQSPKVVREVSKTIDDASEELRRLNLEIFNNPEQIFKEFKACKLISDWLENRGWTVKRGVYGIETAFEAQFSVREGGRTVCFNAEYDALPMIGHACGHNLIATSTLASAVAVEAVLQTNSLPGTVMVMGTPAEESGGGKWIMGNNGAWRGVDACVMTHGMPNFSTPLCITVASWKVRARFHGQGAHAAAAPWKGCNACDAIVHAYTAMAMMRQHIEKTQSIQGCILEAGKAANLVPDYAEGVFSIRAPTMQKLKELRVRFEPIFEAAATATGCTVTVDWTALYEDVVNNETLAEQYRQYMLQHLGLTPEQMLPLAEAKIAHAQAGSS
ncbi:amidohydrolase [Ilyonectria robusta]